LTTLMSRESDHSNAPSDQENGVFWNTRVKKRQKNKGLRGQGEKAI